MASAKRVEQTDDNARRARQDMELAGLELREFMEILARNFRQQGLKRLKSHSNV